MIEAHPANRREADHRLGRGVAAFLATLACGLLHAAPAGAHNPDSSYARFRIAADGYEATFVHDVTSLSMIDPDLDADGDRRITPAELEAALPRIEAFLRSSIALEIDGEPVAFGPLGPVAWPIAAGASIAEQDYHAPTSLVAFPFTKPLDRMPADVWVRFGIFETLGGRHTVLGSIAHEGREEPVLFSEREPDYLFDTALPDSPPPAAGGESAAAGEGAGRRSSRETVWTRLRQFFLLGVEHILVGYDHILFLLALIVVSRPRELVSLVTAFTVAHSITLALATLGWVNLPATLVETAIAATIVYTAAENFWITDTAGRWKTTFAFGLVHGFGFAGVLRDLGLPTDGFVRALVAFNLGVEAGQLAIVAALAWPAIWLARWRHGRTAGRLISAAIGLCGLGWFVDRAFGLGLMPL
ncbi:MAG: HupE/UreJ family protein [Planctomycetia bacterium]